MGQIVTLCTIGHFYVAELPQRKCRHARAIRNSRCIRTHKRSLISLRRAGHSMSRGHTGRNQTNVSGIFTSSYLTCDQYGPGGGDVALIHSQIPPPPVSDTVKGISG